MADGGAPERAFECRRPSCKELDSLRLRTLAPPVRHDASFCSARTEKFRYGSWSVGGWLAHVGKSGAPATYRPRGEIASERVGYSRQTFFCPDQTEQARHARLFDMTPKDAHSPHHSPLTEIPMVRSGALIVALVLAVLFVPSAAVPMDAEKQLLGVWKLESFYTEFQATGEKKMLYGERPNGYVIFTPEKRMIGIITAEGRKRPTTDEDRAAAFLSMISYSGIYRVEGDKWITKVDVSWTEAWTGTDQLRFFKVDGDKLEVTSMWLQLPNLPAGSMSRGVLIWSRVKAQ
jgi:hypothetical protein